MRFKGIFELSFPLASSSSRDKTSEAIIDCRGSLNAVLATNSIMKILLIVHEDIPTFNSSRKTQRWSHTSVHKPIKKMKELIHEIKNFINVPVVRHAFKKNSII